MVVKGEILMKYGKKKKILKEGDVLPMKQKTFHSFTALKNSLILEVSLPSIKKDNFFRCKKIGII